MEHGTQDFQYAGLDIFNISNVKQRAFGDFILVFYSDWLIIRKFYLNLYKAQKTSLYIKLAYKGKCCGIEVFRKCFIFAEGVVCVVNVS